MPRPARFVVGQRGVGGVEQAALGGGVARGGANGVAFGGDARRDDAERVGAAVEALAQLGLDARDGVRVRGAEPRPFERPAGRADRASAASRPARATRQIINTMQTAYN